MNWACAGDNKSYVVFAFLALLVQSQLIQQVHINFMPVGHTHEDVEGFFGNLASKLQYQSAMGIEDMLRHIRESRVADGAPVKAWVMKEMMDAKAYLKNLLPAKPGGITTARSFRLMESSNPLTFFNVRLEFRGHSLKKWSRGNGNQVSEQASLSTYNNQRKVNDAITMPPSEFSPN